MRGLLLLPLLLAIPTAAQPPHPNDVSLQEGHRPQSTLSGRVLNATSGEPVAGAQVMVVSLGSDGSGFGAVTDRNGRFWAADLRPGLHYLQATHPDFPGPFGLPQAGVQIDLQTGQAPTEVVIKLLPAGVISGQVLDDGGEPVSGCDITLFTARIGGVPGSTGISGSTDDEGHFRLEPIAPDRYVVSARCEADLPAEHILDVNQARGFETTETWQRVFYQDSSDFAAATEIGVTAAAEVQVEFRLKPQAVRTLQGFLTSTEGLPYRRPALVHLARSGTGSDPTVYETAPVNQEDGTFRFRAVPPGSYQLYGLSSDATSETRYGAHMAVTVGEAEPPRVILPLRPLPVLTGRVEARPKDQVQQAGPSANLPGAGGRGRVAGGWSQGIVTLTPSPRADHISDQQASVNPQDGSFQFPGITPGRWKVHYYARRQPAWIESIQYGDNPVEDGEIEVVPGSTAVLRIRTSSEFASPRFALKIPLGAPRSFWVIHTVPAQRSRTDPTIEAAAGYPDSLMALAKLPPGPYYVFGVPHSFGGGISSERLSEIMIRQLEPVEIPASGKVVEVRCFLHDEMQRILASYIAGEAR